MKTQALSREGHIASTSFKKQAMATTHWILAAISLALPVAILLHIDRGIDFTDTGYYHVSIQYLHEIDMQTSQFAVVWNLLPLPDNIIWHRVTLLILMIGSAVYMFTSVWKFIWRDIELSLPEWGLLSALAMGAVGTFYIRWLPDPSYNSIALCLNMVLVGLAFSICRHLQHGEKFPWIESILAGLLFSALALVRPPTALVLSIPSAALVLVVARPKPEMIIRVCALVLTGLILYTAINTIFVEPLTDTIERLLGGLQRRELLSRTSGGLLSSPLNILTGMKITIVQNWIFGLITVAGFMAVLAEFNSKFEREIKLAAQFTAMIGLAGLFYTFAGTYNGIVRMNVRIVVGFYWALGLTAFVGTLLACILERSAQKNRPVLNLLIVCAFMLVAQFSAVAGTSNNTSKQIAFFGVFSLLALYLTTVRAGRMTLSPLFLMALLIGWATQYTAWQHMSLNPYRLAAPLSEQVHPTKTRNGKTELKVDTATHNLLQNLSRAVTSKDLANGPPVLIDLTGRLPLMTYHLNFKTMRSPWVLSTYPGSQTLFDFTLDRLPKEVIERAWILDGPGYKYRFSSQALRNAGMTFPKDYVLKAQGYSDYLKSDILLYAPKTQAANQ